MIERMFVLTRIKVAERPPGDLDHMDLRDRETRDRWDQVMRVENLSARPITCLCGYQRNVRDNP